MKTFGTQGDQGSVLEELGNEDALSKLYEKIYLESNHFCKEYAQRLIDEGNEDRAIEVIEDGIHTFRSPRDLRWLAADLYEDRDMDEYRDTLKQLFLDHTEWAAYDDLKAVCDDQEWQSIYEEFERDDRKEFVDFLKDKHSNRPAFLDELEKAGF